MEGVMPLPTRMIPLKGEVSNQKMFSMNLGVAGKTALVWGDSDPDTFLLKK
jgi:hypothetical protein